jgi:hypothetical protein
MFVIISKTLDEGDRLNALRVDYRVNADGTLRTDAMFENDLEVVQADGIFKIEINTRHFFDYSSRCYQHRGIMRVSGRVRAGDTFTFSFYNINDNPTSREQLATEVLNHLNKMYKFKETFDII